jgi:pancreatic triacylglycerol lipase
MNEYNIFLVVWEKGAKVPMYHLAATNTRVVGALVAFFINQLAETYKISNDNFYIIGHSLGAHVSGYAGKRLHDPKVSRITGLDPAGPGIPDFPNLIFILCHYFIYRFSGFHFNEPHMRLHPSDAQQVDVIHTDCADIFTDGLGLNQPFGYIDFYPNGGMSQPGCPMSKGIVNLVSAALSGEEISCSHTRAYFFAGTMG